MDPKMEVAGVNFYYQQTHTLKQISLDIRERQITSLIGPSGCGKSTLLRCLNRLNEIIPGTRLEGRVLLDGQNIYAPVVNAVEIRKRVGMVFQQPNPFPKSIFENVVFGCRMLGQNDRASLDETAEKSLKKAAIWDEVKDNLNKSGLALSAGQQQRLCIARVLAVEPEVILMDEPCSALDPMATLKIEELMAELKQNYTIAIVTHDMQQAARVSDWTGLMLAGELIEYGKTSDLFERPQDRRTEAYITGRYGTL